MVKTKVLIFLAIFLHLKLKALAQQNTGAILYPFLRECYSESYLMDRNNLPPMTLSVMLDIIRKIEDHPRSIGDIRQISTGIVHLFRQDGIVFDPTIPDASNVVPYSPTGFPADKNRLLLHKLIPSNQFELPNNILTSNEKCTLHHMLSSSLQMHKRVDEETTCNELFGPEIIKAQYKMLDRRMDIEIFDVNKLTDTHGRQIVGVSNCPIETGVVSTSWGDVAMSTVVTGISSGLEEQNVKVADLVAIRPEFRDAEAFVVNNRYASTISGDIAEVAAIQGTTRFRLSVGAPGGWNSSYIRKHYFVTKNEDLEFTNAEFRGGLDGLILSELGMAYSNDFPELKLSQILDMYYSYNGIMHEKRFRACNRKVLVPDIASRQTLFDQSIGPTVALYHVSQFPSTTDLRGLQTFLNNTVNAVLDFIPLNLNESICTTPTQETIRPKINLILVTEPIFARRDHIAYIADMIDVGKFGSSIALMNIESGDMVVEKTFSLSTFHVNLMKNIAAHTGPPNLIKVLKSLEAYSLDLLHEEFEDNYSGGNATIALFLTDAMPLSDTERLDAIFEAQKLRNLAPDLRLLFATGSASGTVLDHIFQDYDDFIPIVLNDLSSPSVSLAKLKDYLEVAPRRIVNPLCGSQWPNEDSGTTGFEDFVDADGLNIYRIMPNYFYGTNVQRVLRIESTDYGPISVCYSWTNKFPRRDRVTSTVPGDVICESAANQGIVEIDLSNACSNKAAVIACPSLYVSVSSTTIPGKPQCKENGCRYPNDVKYLVVTHELSCHSGVVGLNKLSSLLLLLLIFTT